MDKQNEERWTVVDDDGERGVCLPFAEDAERVAVAFGERTVHVPAAQLRRQSDGSYRLPLRLSHYLDAAEDDALVVPIVAETVTVGRRVRETGKVRIHKAVREEEEEITLPLVRQTVEIERVPIDRVVERPPSPRREGDTLIVPVVEEVLVVEKKLVLKEEVRITTVRSETEQTERITLRKEEVTVDRVQPDDAEEGR